MSLPPEAAFHHAVNNPHDIGLQNPANQYTYLQLPIQKSSCPPWVKKIDQQRRSI
jgi:hypothetical protein